MTAVEGGGGRGERGERGRGYRSADARIALINWWFNRAERCALIWPADKYNLAIAIQQIEHCG